MSIQESVLAELPAVLRAFVERHRLPAAAVRRGGRVGLTLERRHLVSMIGAPHGRVALQSDLIVLEEGPPHRTDDMLLRLVVTGRKASPPLFETMAVLGKEVTRRRLRQAADRLARS